MKTIQRFLCQLFGCNKANPVDQAKVDAIAKIVEENRKKLKRILKGG